MQKLLELQTTVACTGLGTQVIFSERYRIRHLTHHSGQTAGKAPGGRLVKSCVFRAKYEENGVFLSSFENSNIITFKYFNFFLKYIIPYSS